MEDGPRLTKTMVELHSLAREAQHYKREAITDTDRLRFGALALRLNQLADDIAFDTDETPR